MIFLKSHLIKYFKKGVEGMNPKKGIFNIKQLPGYDQCHMGKLHEPKHYFAAAKEN